MKPKTRRLRSLAIASSALLTISYAQAADLYWDSNGTTAGAGATPTGTWGTSNFWNTDSTGDNLGAFQTATTNADDLFFVAGPGAASGNNAYVVTVNGAQVANSLTFQASGATTLSGGTSITLGNGTPGSGGITMNQFAYGAVAQGAVNINTAVILNNSQTWTNNAAALTVNAALNNGGNTLTFTGSGTTSFGSNAAAVISGAGGVTMNGTGRLFLGSGTAPAHTYSGATTLNGGVTMIAGNLSANSNLVMNGGVLESYWTTGLTRTQGTGAGQIQIIGGESGFGMNGSNSATINIGAVTWGSSTFDPTKLVLQTQFSQGTSALTFSSAINLNGADRTIIANSGVAGTATSTISGIISNSAGTAGLIKEGPGRLSLTQTNTFNGAVTVTGGSLFVSVLANGGSNSGLGSSSAAASNILLGNGATLGYAGGAVSTNRSFTINGSAAGHGAALDASGSGAVNWTNTASPAYGTIDQTRTLTLTGTNTGNNIFAANITDNGTGAVSLTKSGAGTWQISGNNVNTGATTITGGALVLANANALNGGIGTTGGISALTFNGGVLGLGTGNFTRNLGTAGTSTDVNFTGAGGWAAFGADRLVNLGGSSAQVTWATANTGFNGQTLILSNASATHKVTLENGLDLGTAIRTVQTDNGTATVDAELSGIITGGAGGGLTKTGAGTLSLSNANTYTGRTTVNAGVLLLENATALSGGIGSTGGTSNLTFTGGVLGLGAGNFERSLGTNATATAVNFTNAGGWAAYGADRTVNLGGAGAQVTWATANTGFNGQTVILGATSATHTVTLANDLDLGTGTRTVQVDNGTAVIDAILSGDIIGTGTGTNGLTKTGAGTLALSGTNTYSGATQGPRSASGTIIFQGAQALSDNTTISYINGGGVGTGPSYKILHDTTSTITKSTGILMNSSDNTSGLTIFVGNNGSANDGNGAGGTTGGTIALGNFNVTENGAGKTSQTLSVTGANSYRLQINNVTTNLAATHSGAYSAIFNPTTAPLTIAGNVQQSAGSTGTTTLGLDGTASGNLISGNILNSLDGAPKALSVSKTNTSEWILSGTGSNYTGATTVSGGTLAGIGANAFGSTSGISIAAAGTLSLRGDGNTSFVKASDSSAYAINTTASGATINVDQATVAGTGAKTMTIGAIGTSSTAATYQLNFTGANNTSLSAGIVTTPTTASVTTHTINNTISGGGSLTLAGVSGGGTTTGTLAFTGTGDTAVTGAITQAGSAQALTKSGAGKLTLQGINGYTGATAVNAGTLEIALGGSTHASSAFTVSNSGSALVVNGTVNGTLLANASTTISGSGTVAGAATVNGNLNPGNSPGILSFGSSLAMSNTTTTTMQINGTSLGIGYDNIDINGALTYDGALALAIGATFGAGIYTFDLFDISTQSGSFDTVALSGAYGDVSLVNNGFGVWETTTNLGNETWSFDQSTGDLALSVIPEPSSAVLLGALGTLALLRRRR